MRENHYAILVSNLRISYVFKYKISITLLIFLICLGKELPQIQRKNNQKFRQYLATE